MDRIAGGLAAIILLGAAGQWLGWRLRLPSILLLLIFGFIAGPAVLGLVAPDVMFGDLLTPIVSLGVAILLFEGALTLKVSELRGQSGVVTRLLSLGVGITWALSAFFAWWLLDLGPSLAILTGAVLTVTGPTVVLPLLRQVRPTGEAGSILKWEGIVVDPIGAILAVLVFEAIEDGGGMQPSFLLALAGIGRTLLFGTLAGVAGAWILYELLKRFWVPDHLHAATALALTVGAYGAANAFQHEAGLFSVTLMGALLANQSRVDLRHILEFKENLQVLIISSLFILLAARVDMDALAAWNTGAFVFLAVLILIVRPLSVAACTWGSSLSRSSRLFIAALAPRGVVAAAVTAVFALRLVDDGYTEAGRLVPIMFLVIVGTVAVYGLSASPLAQRLGLAVKNPQGVLIVGAHAFARSLAKALNDAGLKTLVVDTNAARIAKARMEGIDTFHGNVLSEHADDSLDLPGIGRLFAMTPNAEINALTALHYIHLFGRGGVFQLTTAGTEGRGDDESLPPSLRARILFGDDCTYEALSQAMGRGASVRATTLTEQFDFEAWRREHGPEALPLLKLNAAGKMTVATRLAPIDGSAGDTIIALLPA